MSDLTCTVQDQDNFSNTLLVQYIDQTPGISLVKKTNANPSLTVDILFVDADQVKPNSSIEIVPSTHVVIVSSNNKYIHSLFKDQVADYLSKSDLTYARFLDSIEKIKRKIAS